jgi:hypothetical protein
MDLEQRILAIGQGIERIVDRLNALGYQFANPSAVLPGPEPDTCDAIARIECEIGPLPLALKLFWQRVGSVNLIGHHPQWEGCDYPDSLVIFPASLAIEELDSFLEDREERLRHNYPYEVPIAPDAKHKQDVSGGPPYTIAVPAVADDPPLQSEPHNTTFVSYLELALRWGGFPGLDDWSVHTWPLPSLAYRLA